jgi:hypothetical protein
MKKEVYRIYKMMEALNDFVRQCMNNGVLEGAENLSKKHKNLCIELKTYLSEEESKVLEYQEDEEIIRIKTKHATSTGAKREILVNLLAYLKLKENCK